MKKFQIDWKSPIGYGDFMNAIGYAHNARIKFDREVNINFWHTAESGVKYKEEDNETLSERIDYINTLYKDNELVPIKHIFKNEFHLHERPNYAFRFRNNLHEFNILHGIGTPKEEGENKKYAVMWTPISNKERPIFAKCTVFHPQEYDQIAKYIKSYGYDVYEIDYITPVKEVMNLVKDCSFGVGYRGCAYQLFKLYHKPVLMFSEKFNSITFPWDRNYDSCKDFITSDLEIEIEKSRNKMIRILEEHKIWLNEKMIPEDHELYNYWTPRRISSKQRLAMTPMQKVQTGYGRKKSYV